MNAWGSSWGNNWGVSWGTSSSSPAPVPSAVSGGEYRRRRSGLGPSGYRKKEHLENRPLEEEKQSLQEAIEVVKVDIQFASSEPIKEKLRIELDGLERKIRQIEEEMEVVFVLAHL